jgi:hypothetical protein
MWVHLNHLKTMIPRTLPEFHYEEGATRVEPLTARDIRSGMDAERAQQEQMSYRPPVQRYNPRRRH